MMWTTRLRSDYPEEITGIRMGSGEPLVLIHGVGLTADSWGAQLEPLAARFAVHALDLPGHGESKPLPTPVSLADLTDTMASAIGAFDEPVRLAGHSVGALIALDLAARYPDLVKSVAALNGIHRRSADALSAVRERAASLSATSPNDPTATVRRWFGDDLTEPCALACRRWLDSVNPAAYKATYTAFAEADSPSDEALANLICPVLFLTGRDEPNSTPAMSQAMAALTPQSQVVIIDGAAHMAMMTHASEVNGALIDFFRGTHGYD